MIQVPWRLHRAELEVFAQSLSCAAGLPPLVGAPLAAFSEGVRAAIWYHRSLQNMPVARELERTVDGSAMLALSIGITEIVKQAQVAEPEGPDLEYWRAGLQEEPKV